LLVDALGVGVGDGLGDTDAEGDGSGLVAEAQPGNADGPGLALGRQVGDADGWRVRVPDPADEAGWDGVRLGDAVGCPPPAPGCPPRGCEFELLGDTAVETSIATYVPAATMKMTTAIAASGRSQPSARERCLPGVTAGTKRSQAARSPVSSR
jgi:hypothetical protein